MFWEGLTQQKSHFSSHTSERLSRASAPYGERSSSPVKHILIECADLLEIRKKYFEERSLYSPFRNVIPEIIFDSCERLVCFTKYEVC